MSDYPMLISNKLHSFRNFFKQIYFILMIHTNIPLISFIKKKMCIFDI